MTPETLLSNLKTIKNSNRSDLENSLIESLQHGFVERFRKGDERPCEKEDFASTKMIHETHLTTITQIICGLDKSDYFSDEDCLTVNTKILSLILILCGENAYEKPWNTEKSVENCQQILKKVLEVFDCCSVSKLITTNKSKKLIKEILENLRPKLLKTTWKQYPAAVISYKWILEMIEAPEISKHLSSILPTALLLIDDFVNENRILGMHCLKHIVNNLTLAELQFHGHGDVIYNALLPLTRIRESEIVNALIPSLICITSKMETDIGRKQFGKWSRFDDVLEIFLENMELESQIDLRDSYVRNLNLVLNASNLEIIRWTKRLLRIFKEYLVTGGKYSDDITINYSLKSVRKFMEVTQTARSVYAKDLLFVLLNALYYMLKEDTEIRKENKTTACALIKEINVMTPSDKEELMNALADNSLKDSEYYEIVKNLLEFN